jgi:hypothetical protein
LARGASYYGKSWMKHCSKREKVGILAMTV